MDFEMTASDELVQRFLDQELSGEERVQFLLRLGRESALRERLVELEQLLLDVSRLPRPAVPEGFVARVIERSAPALGSWWRRAVDALWAPRTFQWNLASAVAAVSVVLLVAGAFVAGGMLARWERAADGPAASPVMVRLVVLQPGARTVHLAGDFNGWDPARTPLEPAADGAWVVTIPLRPGRYEYMYVVDGQKWMADPFAVEQNDDGFGSSNAVLDVRPAKAPL